MPLRACAVRLAAGPPGQVREREREEIEEAVVTGAYAGEESSAAAVEGKDGRVMTHKYRGSIVVLSLSKSV